MMSIIKARVKGFCSVKLAWLVVAPEKTMLHQALTIKTQLMKCRLHIML